MTRLNPDRMPMDGGQDPHGGGEPASPDPTERPTEKVPRSPWDEDERRAQAVAQFQDQDANDAADLVAEEMSGGELHTQQDTETEEVEDAETVSDEHDWEQELELMKRQHAAQMAAMQDGYRQQLESLQQLMSGRNPDPEPEPPDPDLDPKGYIDHTINPVQQELHQLQQQMQAQEQRRRLEMVSSHLQAELANSEVFRNRNTLAGDVEQRVLNELFNDPQVTMENWKERATDRIRGFEQRYGPELGVHSSNVKKARQAKANAKVPKSAARGGQAATPAPQGFELPDDFDFTDEDQRRAAFLRSMDTD